MNTSERGALPPPDGDPFLVCLLRAAHRITLQENPCVASTTRQWGENPRLDEPKRLPAQRC